MLAPLQQQDRIGGPRQLQEANRRRRRSVLLLARPSLPHQGPHSFLVDAFDETTLILDTTSLILDITSRILDTPTLILDTTTLIFDMTIWDCAYSITCGQETNKLRANSRPAGRQRRHNRLVLLLVAVGESNHRSPRGDAPSARRSEEEGKWEEEEEEEEEESLFKADAVNEEDSERDRATQV
jgi:hypothetical protein